MSWMEEEPVRGGYPDPGLLGLPGLDRMRAGFRQQMVPPPIFHLFGLQPVAASPAAVTFSMPCSPWLQTDAGVFFAGTAALVADAALSGAVLTALGPGKVAVTSDLSMSFLRPVDTSSRQLIARARPIEIGKTLGLAEGLVEDGHGRIVAHGTTRCFIISMDVPALSEEPARVEWPSYGTPDPHERPLPDGCVDPKAYDEKTFLEIIAERAAGQRPPAPFAQLFGGGDIRGEPGRFGFRVPSSPWLTSPAGTVYGGMLAYIADSALTGVIGTTLSTDEAGAPLDLKVQFVRPVWPDGRDLVVEAWVLHRGRTFAAARTEIRNADGKLVALGMSSSVIRSGGSWGSIVVADEPMAMQVGRD